MSFQINRTHFCGVLRTENLDQEVTLCGWVNQRRLHGGMLFLDLRDREGVVQIVFDPQCMGEAAYQEMMQVKLEYVLTCRGTVRRRPEKNPHLLTGEIEVLCIECKVLSAAKTPPFLPTFCEERANSDESLRLKYRYLELRHPRLQKNLKTRHRMLSIVRNYLDSQGFLEIDTPILYKSTPEGARDFIVPSRLNPGYFYALPQSPQILKQLLMMGGFDRYYQIARCFRDEDLRADRQPEFSQIDLETSFLREEDLFSLIESLMSKLWKEILNQDLSIPFPRMTYQHAMSRFGTDKPDLRFGLELQDVSDLFRSNHFPGFQEAFSHPRGSVRCFVVPQGAEKFSRKELEKFQEIAIQHQARGFLWLKVLSEDQWVSSLSKFLQKSDFLCLKEHFNLKPQDLVLLIADRSPKIALEALGALRLVIAEKLDLIPKKQSAAFLWVVNFPLLEWNEKDQRYYACHHPFTAPRLECLDDFMKGDRLEDLQASAYDLVLNGVEVGGGSLRIYRPEVQSAMFRILGLSEQEAKEKFGFFLEALDYGTPPHGGMALGVERLAAILCGVNAIRDVMAFPKTQRGHCLMSSAPSRVGHHLLEELSLHVS